MRHIPQPSERYLRFIGRLDRVTVALVLLLAFVLGSFPARNADVWMHLASGRLITHLDYPFGGDPFNFTTADQYWANHAWLFDTLLYGITALGGPEGFGGILATLLKGLAVIGLAGLMMSIRRPNQSLWAPACVTALSLITLSPALELRPVLVSLIFLALTLRILARDGKRLAAPHDKWWARLWSASPQRLYALPILFVLWVNLDGWFWLGPMLVGLFIVGDWLQENWTPILSGPEAPDPDEKRTLWKVLGLGLLACLISPYHFRGLTVPADLFAASRFPELKGDALFQSYFVGPFDGVYFTPLLGMNVAGLMYILLLGGVIGSFVLNRAGWRWWRLIVFGVFTILSLLHMRLIPFFAVVAGPIAALNIHDFIELEAGRKLAEDVRWRRTAIVGRGIALQTLAVLLILAVAGWLLPPQAGRRVGFGIVADPSLKDVSLKHEEWRRAGRLPAGNVVNVHPDLAAYFAWFAPSTKGFFDERIDLMDRSMSGYVRLRGLTEPQRPTSVSLENIWPGIQRTWNANQVALYGGDVSQTARLFSLLLQAGPDWTLLGLDGRAAWFGWHDPAWAALRHEPAREAFGAGASRAPPHGPQRLPAINYLTHFFFGTPERPSDADLARMYVAYYQAAGKAEREATLRQGAGLVGFGLSQAPFSAGLAQVLMTDLPTQIEPGPPAAPILAVRAARRAIAANPDDLIVYLYLDQGYELLGKQEDRWVGDQIASVTPKRLLRELSQGKSVDFLSPWVTATVDHRRLLRQVQRLAALRTHLRIDPDSDYAHRSLYEMLWTMNYYDVALEHLRAEVDILRRQRGRELEARERLLEENEREVEMLRRYAQSTKAQSAESLLQPFGLAGEAMTQGRQGKATAQDHEIYLYLLLTTGRIEELDAALHDNPALPKLLGTRFHRYEGLLAAARGNYQEADQHFKESIQLLTYRQSLMELLQSRTIDGTMPLLGRLAMAPRLRQQAIDSGKNLINLAREAAELNLLRGLAALEMGDVAAAADLFRLCLDAVGSDSPYVPVARRYLELIERPARSRY